jgi:hypothetical protein
MSAMKLAIASLVCGVGVGALTAQSQAPRPGATPATSQAMDKAIVVTGCLQRIAPVGSLVAAGAAAPATTFKLTGVAPAVGSTPTGAPARGAAPPATPLAPAYQLVAMGGVELGPHGDHKVQLTGTVTPAEPEPAPVRDAAPAGQNEPPLPTLHVIALTMLASSCK